MKTRPTFEEWLLRMVFNSGVDGGGSSAVGFLGLRLKTSTALVKLLEKTNELTSVYVGTAKEFDTYISNYHELSDAINKLHEDSKSAEISHTHASSYKRMVYVVVITRDKKAYFLECIWLGKNIRNALTQLGNKGVSIHNLQKTMTGKMPNYKRPYLVTLWLVLVLIIILLASVPEFSGFF